jgi:hypothetical protein
MARVSPYAQDVVLAAAFALAALAMRGPFATALLVAVPAVFAWGVVTLHFPARVHWNDERIVFSAYGRAHAFAWADVARIDVRRFVVKDRVLVRLSPAGAWRGRYWITDAVDGYAALVAELERRSADRAARLVRR